MRTARQRRLRMSFGPHVNRYHAPGKRPGMAAHVDAACREAAGAGLRVGAVSLFVSEGRNVPKINLHPDERAPLAALLAASGVRAIAHSAYRAWPWGGNPAGAAHIREELRVCGEAGVEGLVVHLPKDPIATVMKFLPRLLGARDGDPPEDPLPPGVRIYFETPAVVPRETYYETPKKLAALFTAIRTLDPHLDRFGLCVDTAHLWVSGVDLSTYAAAGAWFRGLEAEAKAIPPDRVMLHLNDSQLERGRGPDKHAPLARGRMWEGFFPEGGQDPPSGGLAASGLAAVVNYARRHGTPTILERDAKELLRGDYRIIVQLAPEVRVAAGGPLAHPLAFPPRKPRQPEGGAAHPVPSPPAEAAQDAAERDATESVATERVAAESVAQRANLLELCVAIDALGEDGLCGALGESCCGCADA